MTSLVTVRLKTTQNPGLCVVSIGAITARLTERRFSAVPGHLAFPRSSPRDRTDNGEPARASKAPGYSADQVALKGDARIENSDRQADTRTASAAGEARPDDARSGTGRWGELQLAIGEGVGGPRSAMLGGPPTECSMA